MRKTIQAYMRTIAIGGCVLIAVGCGGGVPKHYRAGEVLYVLADGGLALREKPDAVSKALATVPYGAPVTVEEVSFFQKAHREGAVRGYWLAVRRGSQRGFLFDGILSRYPAFRQGKESRDEYFARALGAPAVERSEKNGTTVIVRRYPNGVRIVTTQGGIDCVEKIEYVVPAVRIEAAFFLFQYQLTGLDRVREFPARSYGIPDPNDRDQSLMLNVHVKKSGDEVTAIDFLQDGIAYTCGIYREGDGVRAEECLND